MKKSSSLNFSLVFVLTSLMSSSISLNQNNIVSWKRFDVVRDYLIELPIIDILELTMDSTIKIYEAVEAEKNQVEIISHFSSIEGQLSDIEQELQNIIQLLEKMGIAFCYYPDEIKIRKTQLIFKRYLHDSTEENLQLFFKETSDLYTYIEHLMDGLLGNNNVFCPFGDILTTVRDASGCGMRLKNKINAVMGLVMTGVWLIAEYEKMSSTSVSFEESILNSSILLLERLETEMLNCHPDEGNVNSEMRDIINKYWTEGREVVTDTLFQFLEDKYETKKWVVIVHPETGAQSNVYYAISGGFHSVSANGMVAIAISVDRALTLDWVPLKDFRFPIETVNNVYQIPPSIGFSLKPKRAARDVHEYLSLDLKPLRNKFIIESLVIETPCQSSEEEMKKVVTVVTSNGTENTLVINNNEGCVGHVVLIVPVNSSHSNSSLNPNTKLSVYQDCNDQTDFNVNQTGLLRNEFGQAYLSVQGDSSQEATSIILESEWRNSTGQRWRFVNSQLKNDLGKCLTAWKEQSWYLYQYDCHSDWAGQIWYRHGFQIVNSFNMCLAYEGTKSGLMYVVQDLCDSTPPFLWYNWDTACEDAIVIPSSSVESRPLRNEFSREYLSVYEDEVYLFHKPWSNQPGQKWKFVDGQLRNDRNKCLEGKGWYARQVDCDDVSSPLSAKTWAFNEKRQVISADGYCLSVGDKNGYVLNNNCKDDPEYRWWY